MEDSDSEDIERDYKKSIKTVQTSAYREAILEETDALSQHQFDIGYSRGMRTGLVTGFYEGVLNAIANIEKPPICQETLETIKSNQRELETLVQTQCQLCDNKKLNGSSVSDVKQLQEDANAETVLKLTGQYASILDEIKLSKDEIIDIFPP